MLGMVGPDNPSRKLPLGTAKTLNESLWDVIGASSKTIVNATTSKTNDEVVKKLLAHRQTGLMPGPGLPKEIKPLPNFSGFDDRPKMLPFQFLTGNKRPVAAYLVPDASSDSMSYFLVLALRNKCESGCGHAWMVESSAMCASIMKAVFTTSPQDPCNFHPWFSSLVYQFRSIYHTIPQPCSVDFVKSKKVVYSKVIIAALPPCTSGIEAALHNLTVDFKDDDDDRMTYMSRVRSHILQWKTENCSLHTWKCTSDEDVALRLDETFATLDSIASQSRDHKPVAAEGAAASHRAAPVGNGTKLHKGTSVPPAVRDESTKKRKLVAGEAAEARSSEDAREAAADEHFATNVLDAHVDSDDSGSGSSSGSSSSGDVATDDDDDDQSPAKRRKKRRIKTSDSDNSEGGSSSKESDDESGEEEDDDDSSSSSSSLSVTSTSKDINNTPSGASVQSNDDEQEDPPEAASSRSISKAKESTSVDMQPHKKMKTNKEQHASAQSRRTAVANEFFSVLDLVDELDAIPLVKCTVINDIVSKLRSQYTAYSKAHFPIKESYELHMTVAALLKELVTLHTSPQPRTQSSIEDARATKKLAVNNARTMVHLTGFVETMKSQIDDYLLQIPSLARGFAESIQSVATVSSELTSSTDAI